METLQGLEIVDEWQSETEGADRETATGAVQTDPLEFRVCLRGSAWGVGLSQD